MDLQAAVHSGNRFRSLHYDILMENSHGDLLFRKLGTGGESALEAIFDRYHNELANHCFDILSNEALAQEAVMDALLVLWEHRKKVSTMDKPLAWLYTCARNKALNILRSEKRRGTVGLNDSLHLPEATGTEKKIDVRELERLIPKAIEQLPPKQKEIIELVWKHGWTRQQIAQHRGLSENTVKNHIAEARHNLQRSLKTVLLHLLI